MSADNWTTCPQCGKETLREDYEQGIWGRMYHVHYTAACRYGRNDGCGFKFSHNEELSLPLSEEAKQ